MRATTKLWYANCRDNKQENLSRIPYTVYRPAAQRTSPVNSTTHATNSSLPPSLNRRDTNTLRHAERCLRREGTIVLADREKAELWVFQIEGFPQPSPVNPSKDGGGSSTGGGGGGGADDSMDGEVQAQIAEEETEGKWKRLDGRLRDEWGLQGIIENRIPPATCNPQLLTSSPTESTTGAFLASTLAPPAPPPTATFRSSATSTPLTPSFPPTPGMFPPQSHNNGPPTIDLTDDDPPPSSSHLTESPDDRHIAYKHFITATLHSLLFTLALQHGYTPLNIRTLVAPSWSSTKGKGDDAPLLPSSPLLALPEVVRPTVLALEAYLTSAGTLLIVPHTEIQPAIRRVGGTTIAEGDGTGRDVYIAPWGEWGRLIPPSEGEGAAMTGKEEAWKRDVKSYLQDCGVLGSQDEGWEKERSVLEEAVMEGVWRRIEIWVPFKELPGMGMVVKVLWPEALLFVKASEDDPVLALAPEKDKDQDANEIKDEDTDATPTAAPQQDTEDDLWWKSVFTSPEYSRFASGGLSISLASLVLSSAPRSSGTKQKDLGAEWWDIPSAVDWAEEWLNTKEERTRIIKARSEEKKAARRAKEEKDAEKEEAEKIKSEEVIAAKTEPEAMDTKEEGAAKLKVEAKANPGGVYPTPPDGGAGQQMGPGSTSSGSAPSTVMAVSTAPTSTVPTEMDLDWSNDLGGVADAVPEQGRKQSDVAAIGGLAGGTGEADLFGGDMDEDEMFGQGITEDDFAFFDNPGDLSGFGDDELGGDVDMGLGEVGGMDLSGMGMGGGGGGDVDLAMESPGPQEMVVVSSPAVPMIQLPETRKEDGAKAANAPARVMEKLPEMEPHIQTPPLSPHRAIRLLVPEYSLSPNNQPHPTPPTTGGTVMKTPQHNGPPPPPAGGVSEAKRRMSMYSPITFTTTVEMADRKYAPGGRYFLPESIKEKEQKEFESKQGKLESPVKVSASGGLKRKRGVFLSRVIAVEENNDVVPEMAEVLIGDDAVMEESPEGDEDGEEDSESGWTEESSESDADDETEEEEEEPGGRYYSSPLAVAYGGGGVAGRKRKWAFDEEADGGAAETMKRDTGVSVNGEAETVGDLAPPPWEVMVPDPTDSSLVGVFSNMSLETDAISLAGLGEGEFNAVSKLVREQIVTGTSKPLGTLIGGGAWETAMEDDDEEWCLLRRRKGKDEGIVEDAVKSLFGISGVVRCTLETYVAVADAIIEPPLLVGRAAAMRPLAQPRRGVQPVTLNKRPGATNTNAGDNAGGVSAIFVLKPPHIHIHRAEQALEILPPSLHFWETFGFAPCGGPKNVIGFCLHPASKQMEEAADGFLERVQCAYEGARFGTHVRGRLDASQITDGTVAVEAKGKGSLERGVKALMDAMGEFGAVLANVADELQNIVVYVVNPFEHPSAVVDICAGFVMMKRNYTRAMEGVMGARCNNLVLQIVPARFVAAKLGGVSRTQSEWHTLAAEVYNRCVPTDGMGSLEEV